MIMNMSTLVFQKENMSALVEILQIINVLTAKNI